MCNTTSLASTGRTLGPLARSDHHPGTRDTRPAGTPPSTTGPCGGYVKVTVTFKPGPPQPGPAPFALQEQGSCASTSAAAATRPGPTSGPTGGAGGPRPGRLGTTSASGEVPSNSRGPLRAACADAMEEESDWSVSQVRVAVVGETSHLILAMFITLALGQRGHVGKAPAVASALTSLSRACSRPCTALP